MLEGGRNEFPWFTFTHVPPWTPTTVSAGGLSTSLPSRLHLQSKTLGDENKRVCWRALEWFWQCLAALLDLSSSLACQFFFTVFHRSKGSPMRGWHSFTRAQSLKLGKYESFHIPSKLSFCTQQQHRDPEYKNTSGKRARVLFFYSTILLVVLGQRGWALGGWYPKPSTH